ncbi:MAG TPA: hypothetical protein VI300_11560 [Solirubrobacter sp.]
MFGISIKHPLPTVGLAIAALAASGSASAATDQDLIVYNGHAGLGASTYQHNQTDLEWRTRSLSATGFKDGTSNTIAFEARSPAPEKLVANAILMADMGGQLRLNHFDDR